MNVLTVKKKLLICEVTIYIYIWKGTSDTSERCKRVKRSNIPFERLPRLFWQTFRGKLFLFKIEIVTFSLLCRFSGFFRAEYIISVRNHPFFFFFFTMVSKKHQNRFFAVKFIFEKSVFVIFPCFGYKTTNPEHFEKSCIVASNNNVYSRCVRFGSALWFFFRNLSVNNDCFFDCFFLCCGNKTHWNC